MGVHQGALSRAAEERHARIHGPGAGQHLPVPQSSVGTGAPVRAGIGPEGPANCPNGRHKKPQCPKNCIIQCRTAHHDGLFSVAISPTLCWAVIRSERISHEQAPRCPARWFLCDRIVCPGPCGSRNTSSSREGRGACDPCHIGDACHPSDSSHARHTSGQSRSQARSNADRHRICPCRKKGREEGEGQEDQGNGREKS